MKHNYQIYEDSEEYENEIDFFEKNQNKLKIGDTIEYIPFNQEGYKKYKVLLLNNKKILKLIIHFDF
jgi:hypothetical protein